MKNQKAGGPLFPELEEGEVAPTKPNPNDK